MSDNLRPSSLKAEVSDALNFHELTPQRLLQVGASAYPLAIVGCAVVAGYILRNALKHRSGTTIERDGSRSPSAYQPAIFATLVEDLKDTVSSGIDTVREHANKLSDDLTTEANDQISAASAHIGTAVHDNLETLLGQVPASSTTKPLISALAKLALAYALRLSSSGAH